MARWPRDLWLAAMWDDETLKPDHRAVIYTYAQYARDGDVTWCAYSELLRRTGIGSRATLAKVLKDLESRGWLAVHERASGRRATRYRMTLPPSSAATAPPTPVDNSASGTAGVPLQPVDNRGDDRRSSTPEGRSSTVSGRSGTDAELDHSDHSDKSDARASTTCGSSAAPEAVHEDGDDHDDPHDHRRLTPAIRRIASRISWAPSRIVDALAERGRHGVRNPTAYAQAIADDHELTRWLRGGEPTYIPARWTGPPDQPIATPEGRAAAHAIWASRHERPEDDEVIALARVLAGDDRTPR